MRTTKTLLPLLLSAAFCCLVQCTHQNNNASTQNTPENGATASSVSVARPDKLSVKSPFRNIHVAPVRNTVDPAHAVTLTMSGGTTLDIPAGEFVDEQGIAVTTPVEISFSEFHNAGDIITSGIPMVVRDEHGGDQWMQTAGMFEMTGTTNGREVKIAPGKEIMVNLASQVQGAYDFWFFDPAQGNWINNGTSNPQPVVQQADKAEITRLKALTAEAPVAPAAYDKNKVALNFDINVHRFPELRKLQNIVWQYTGTDRKKDPANNSWIFSTEWEDARIEHGARANEYQLTLLTQEQEYTIPVCPSQKGADLEKAKANYEVMFAAYQQNLAQLRQKESILQGQNEFRRSMAISSMGIHNYDIIWKRPDTVFVSADFDFGSDMPEAIKALITVYLITGDGRTVVALPYYDWTKFRFCSGADNRLLAVLPDNKIAIFSQKDFTEQTEALQKSAAEKTPYVFKMRIKDQPVQSVADVQRQIVAAGS